MKKLLFLGLLLAGGLSYAQFDIGLRGGINYGGSVKIKELAQKSFTDSNLGFHLGFYSKIKFPLIYIMPELVYTQLNSDLSQKGDKKEFRMQKIDMPISVGYNILPFLNAFAGPQFQYIIDTDYTNVNLKNIESSITVGYNIGVGLQISKIGFNIRYEGAFSSNDVEVFSKITGTSTEQNVGKIDTRPSQFIASVTFKLN